MPLKAPDPSIKYFADIFLAKSLESEEIVHYAQLGFDYMFYSTYMKGRKHMHIYIYAQQF